MKETQTILGFLPGRAIDRFEEQATHAGGGRAFFREVVAQDRVGREVLGQMAYP